MAFNTSPYWHLSDRLGIHPELVAAAMLEYILRGSPQVTQDMLGILRANGVYVSPIKGVTLAEGQSMWPDLMCYDHHGHQSLLVKVLFSTIPEENSFAASLDKFRRSHATLLIISPARRMESLWSFLKRLPTDWGTSGEYQGTDLCSITIEENFCLAMISWEALLKQLISRGEYTEDPQTSEIRRLQHFIRSLDWEADVRFSSALFVEEVPLLLANLQRLLHDVNLLIADLGRDARFPVKLGSAAGSLFQDMVLGGYRGSLAVHVGMWMEDESSPLWFEVPLFDGAKEEEVRRKLLPLAHRYPVSSFHGYGLIPIYLPQEADYCETVYYVVAQLREIASLLKDKEAT